MSWSAHARPKLAEGIAQPCSRIFSAISEALNRARKSVPQGLLVVGSDHALQEVGFDQKDLENLSTVVEHQGASLLRTRKRKSARDFFSIDRVGLQGRSIPVFQADQSLPLRQIGIEKAKAMAFAPSGFHSLNQLFHAMTSIQTGKAAQVPIFLLGKEKWTPLVNFFETHLLASQLIKEEDLNRPQIVDSPEELAARVKKLKWKGLPDLNYPLSPAKRIADGVQAGHDLVVTRVHEQSQRIGAPVQLCAVMGSARLKPGSPDYEMIRELVRMLSQPDRMFITGGGPGAMEAANLGALQAGFRSLGTAIRVPYENGANPYVLPEDVVMFEDYAPRKATLMFNSQAFLVTAGGYGTLEEATEVLALMESGEIPKAPVIFVGHLWKGLFEAIAALGISIPSYVHFVDDETGVEAATQGVRSILDGLVRNS